MTAILLSLLGSGGSASPEVFVSGVGASAQVGFAGSQGSNTFSVEGVAASAQLGLVSAGLINNVSVSLTGVQGASAVGSVQAGGEETGLPDGAILFFDRSSTDTPIPSGFNLYTEYQGDSVVNFLIKGGSTNARTTGSPAPVSINSTNPVQSSTDGAHIGPGAGRAIGPGSSSPFLVALGPYSAPAGGHSHDITLTGSATYPSSADFQGTQAPLIKSAGANPQVPAGCIVFSGTSSGFTGCSRKTWTVEYGTYTVSSSVNGNKPSPSNVSPSFGLTTSTAGAHTHRGPNSPGTSGPGPATPLNTMSSAGDHTHPGGSFGHVGAWKQFKHLLPFVATTDTPVESGMIVMYEGISVPLGWNLCDGTNGTPDMVDKFIGYDNSLSTSDVLVGRDVIGSTGPTATTPAPPPSAYGSTSIPVTVTAIPWSHSHVSPASPTTNRPVISASHATTTGPPSFTPVTFPHSHTVPNATVTMPNAYTPQHLTLIFIQKI